MNSCYTAEPFVAKGFRRRLFFPHRTVALRKAYPDTYLQMAKRGIAASEALRLKVWQINLYSPWITGFPDELFTDSAVNWHHQQLGWPGLIASAGVFIDGDSLYISILQSDLCQQIAKHPRLRRTCSTQLDKRFRYWYAMLYNAVLDFAAELGLRRVYSPTGAQIVGTTFKRIDPALFLEIYDYCRSQYDVQLREVGSAEYWCVDLVRNADRIVHLAKEACSSLGRPPRVFCIFHDIEENVDSDANPQECHAALLRMLELEREHGVHATYNILGRIFSRKAGVVAAEGGHSLAFHTYDHCLDSPDQLEQARKVDLQVKGYRTAKSVITPEINDYALSFNNFEWLMSASHSLGFGIPRLENGIVKIPASIDDYYMSIGHTSYSQWLDRIVSIIEKFNFVSIGLHDCYAKVWIDRYPELLERLKDMGELWTCDQITNHVYLASALGEAEHTSASW